MTHVDDAVSRTERRRAEHAAELAALRSAPDPVAAKLEKHAETAYQAHLKAERNVPLSQGPTTPAPTTPRYAHDFVAIAASGVGLHAGYIVEVVLANADGPALIAEVLAAQGPGALGSVLNELRRLGVVSRVEHPSGPLGGNEKTLPGPR